MFIKYFVIISEKGSTEYKTNELIQNNSTQTCKNRKVFILLSDD